MTLNFFFFYSDSYWLYILLGVVMLPTLIFSIVAQTKVSSTFSTYRAVMSKSGVPAYHMARAILDSAGLTHIQVTKVRGNMTDYYDHKNGVLALSETVYDSTSVAALGVAAHEIGHALQYANNYAPVKLRAALVPVLNLSSTLMWPIVLIGILFLGISPDLVILGIPIGLILTVIGICFFGLSVLFSLITLPTEFNASKRALALLSDSHILDAEEVRGAKKVLNAAAMTYVAALLTSIASLLRFVLLILIRSRRNK